jgi:hypothetical protein
MNYEVFKATAQYHGAIAQLYWQIERMIAEGSGYDNWNDEYIVQCVRDILSAYRRMNG